MLLAPTDTLASLNPDYEGLDKDIEWVKQAGCWFIWHTLRKKVLQSTFFLVLQVVTNRGLYSVPGRTK